MQHKIDKLSINVYINIYNLKCGIKTCNLYGSLLTIEVG